MNDQTEVVDLVPQEFAVEIEFSTASADFEKRQIEALRTWLRELLADIAPTATSLGVRLTDDATMQETNLRFRGIDRSTDVLSFPGGAALEGVHLGDILIALPQAERQAREAGTAVFEELQILLLHGVLHCLGLDHETDDGTMERRELKLRDQWIFDNV